MEEKYPTIHPTKSPYSSKEQSWFVHGVLDMRLKNAELICGK